MRDVGQNGLCISKRTGDATHVVYEQFCRLSWNSWAQRQVNPIDRVLLGRQVAMHGNSNARDVIKKFDMYTEGPRRSREDLQVPSPLRTCGGHHSQH